MLQSVLENSRWLVARGLSCWAFISFIEYTVFQSSHVLGCAFLHPRCFLSSGGFDLLSQRLVNRKLGKSFLGKRRERGMEHIVSSFYNWFVSSPKFFWWSKVKCAVVETALTFLKVVAQAEPGNFVMAWVARVYSQLVFVIRTESSWHVEEVVAWTWWPACCIAQKAVALGFCLVHEFHCW